MFGIKTSIDDEAEYQWFSTSSDCESNTLKFNPTQLDPCSLLKLSMEQVKLFLQTFFVENKLRDRFLNCSFIFVKVRDRLFYSSFTFESKLLLAFVYSLLCQLKCLHLQWRIWASTKMMQKKFAWKSKLRIICNLMGVLYPPNFFVLKKMPLTKWLPLTYPR